MPHRHCNTERRRQHRTNTQQSANWLRARICSSLASFFFFASLPSSISRFKGLAFCTSHTLTHVVGFCNCNQRGDDDDAKEATKAAAATTTTATSPLLLPSSTYFWICSSHPPRLGSCKRQNLDSYSRKRGALKMTAQRLFIPPPSPAARSAV